MKHPVAWHTAYPFWRDAVDDGTKAFVRPAILRFKSDTFMEDLAAVLKTDASTLGSRVVDQEDDFVDDKDPVRLYMPAHQRYYLAAASLVCRVRGLPDRKVDKTREESVSFVMRRVDGEDEYGWFGEEGRWSLLEQTEEIGTLTTKEGAALSEERLPMYPVPIEDPHVKVRTLLVGLVPVGRREAYEAGVQADDDATVPDGYADDDLADMRAQVFLSRVIDPLNALKEVISTAQPPTDAEAREVYNFVLLDLADLLNEHFERLWTGLDAGNNALLSDEEKVVFEEITGDVRTELINIWTNRAALLPGDDGALDTDDLGRADVETRVGALLAADTFKNAVNALLVANPVAPEGDALRAATQSTTGAGETYVLRCIYKRPRCEPFEPPVLSSPSVEFTLASFFDPGVPMRPVRISMPVDTSLAGLRRYSQTVHVQLSKSLREQVKRWSDGDEFKPGDRPSLELGMLCSFSIPIITICALILLIIVVSILNIVFWWLPLFRVCLPLNLKAK